MSGFHPTSITLHPPPPPDPLAAALVTALDRNLAFRMTWGLPVVLAAGLASAGLLPLIILLLRFGLYVSAERFQLEHVSEWMQRGGRQSAELEAATARLGRRRRPIARPAAVLAIAACGLALALAGIAPQDALGLWTIWAFAGERPGASAWLASAYGIILLLGYLDLCAAVQAQARREEEFAQAVDPPPQPAGPGSAAVDRMALLWLVLVFVFLAAGALWGAGMMLAGYLHRRYITVTSRGVRMRLARRIESLTRR